MKNTQFEMKPSEHKTVQARILTYAEAIGWTFVPHQEAEHRRRPSAQASHPMSELILYTSKEGELAENAVVKDSLTTAADGELRPEATVKESLTVQVEVKREVRRTLQCYNLNLILAIGYRARSLRGTQFRHFHTDIYGNQKFVEYLRNRGKYSDHEEKRDRNLILTTIPNRSQSKLAEPPMALPLLPEQKKIAHILSTIQQKVDNAQSKKSKLQDLFRTLLHELMTAKMRVHEYKF